MLQNQNSVPATPVFLGLSEITADGIDNFPVGGTSTIATPSIVFVAVPGNTYSLYDNGALIGTMVATQSTSGWTLPALANGAHNLSLTDTNGAGTSAPLNVSFNVQVPGSVSTTTPEITGVYAQGANAGYVAPDQSTGEHSHPTLMGTALPGSIVILYDFGSDGNTMLGSTIATAQGQWSFQITTALSAGEHHFGATADNGVQTFIGDRTYAVNSVSDSAPVSQLATAAAVSASDAPVSYGTAIPLITTVYAHGANAGYIGPDQSTSDAHPTVMGTALPGSIVIVYDFVGDHNTMLGSTIASADGRWSYQITNALPAGAHTLVASADNGVETVFADQPYSFNSISGSAPVSLLASAAAVSASDAPVSYGTAVPLITTVHADGANPGYIGPHQSTSDAHPTVMGTALPGSIVIVYDFVGANITMLGSTIASADGRWSYQIATALPVGEHSLIVTADNGVQTVPGDLPYAFSTVSNSAAVPLVASAADVSVPATPVFLGLSEQTANGIETFGAGGTSTVATPSIVFVAVPGDTYSLYDNGTLIGTMVATKSTTGWTLPMLANGAHNLSLTDTNSAGTSAPLNVSFNVQAAGSPPAPVLLGLVEHTAGGFDNISVLGNGVSHDVNPTVVFATTVGDTYTLYDNGALIGTMVATSTTTAWTLPTLADGQHNLSLTDTNGAGTSAPMQVSFSVDPLPGAPVITSVVDAAGPLAGNIAPGGLSSDGHPVINGTGHPGDTINVYDNTTLLGTTLVGTDGFWSYQPAAALANGAHNLHATESNANGEGAASASYPLSVTYIMITGVYDSNHHLVANGGTTSGAITITGWIADPSIASSQTAIDVSGGGLDGWTRMLNLPLTVVGNTFSVTLSKDTFTGNTIQYLTNGTFSFGVEASGSMGRINTMSDPRLTYTVTDDFNASAVQAVAATHVDVSPADTAVLASSQAVSHTSVGEHDTFKGATGNATVDLNADPAAYFKEATAHIQGGTGGVDTLHLTGSHQVLDLSSLTGKTSAAKVSGIESIDLGGHSNNLKLSLSDVLNLGEQDLFQKDGHQQMMVNGSNGDSVVLSNAHIAGVADGQWQQHGTTQVGGVTYSVYEHSGAHTELLVQQGVQIALHN